MEQLAKRLKSYRSLLDPLREAPSGQPFVTMWDPHREPAFETRSFGEFRQQAERFAALLQTRGVQASDTVILTLPQGIRLMEAFVGAMLLGAIPTILAYPNFKIDPEKYRRGLAGVTHNIGARVCVLDQAFPAHLRRHLEAAGGILVLDKEALASIEPVGEWARPLPEQVAFLQHSAGTTGLQKGVALSHQVVLNQLWELAEALQLSPHDRVASWLPLYHDMGLIACFILPMACHLQIVMESPVDWVMQPDSFLKLITRYRCSLAWVPNFAFQFLARRVQPETSDGGTLDLSSLRALVTTSEPIRHRSLKEFRAAFRDYGLDPNALQTSYGMAENTFAVTQSPLDRPPTTVWVDQQLLQRKGKVLLRPPGDPGAASFVSCGRPLATAEIRVVDPEGRNLGEGRVGEIVVRSRSMYSGYFNRPDLTRQVLKEGWYWTRDVGFLLDGELYAIGRRDDTIIVGGRNLYPQDVEEAAFAHPAIHDGRAVAFGLENPQLGTEDLIVVAEVDSPDALQDRTRLIAELRQAIQSEVGVPPRAVHLVPPKWIIKSTAGKPARSANREKFLKERPEFRPKSQA